MDKVEKELLKEAKRRYPIGTKYDSLGGFKNCIIENQNFIYNSHNDRTITDPTNGTVLFKKNLNKWADIISPIIKSMIYERINYFNAEKDISLKDMIKNIN